MDGGAPGDFTFLLQRARGGDRGAEDELFRLVYDDLRAMASRRMRNVPPHDALQSTALVHESYLRVVGRRGLDWRGRRHFFALAARAMHDVLVEQARRHGAVKRGGGMRQVQLDGEGGFAPGLAAEDLLSLSEAIAALREAQPFAAQVVELRFFAGLNHEECASVLGVPAIRVRREWSYARAFLQDRLDPGRPGPGSHEDPRSAPT
ncbi:MAG: RNA polymerase subunit sigma [Planctomycetes bacterium]|nr:RNA polymerase subunit sigma [Planctomycetota bacterium]